MIAAHKDRLPLFLIAQAVAILVPGQVEASGTLRGTLSLRSDGVEIALGPKKRITQIYGEYLPMATSCDGYVLFSGSFHYTTECDFLRNNGGED